MRIALYIFLGLLAVVVGGIAFAYYTYVKIPGLELTPNATQQQQISAVNDYLEELKERKQFNGAILIAKNGEPLLMKGYGIADVKTKEPLHPESSFRLASVSKQFTATGILLLAERDSLQLDDLVSNHLDGFKYEGVTIRHLLNQTSGVPDSYMGIAEKYKYEVGEVLTIAKVVELVNKYGPKAERKPGEEFAYSNTNYVLLAGIIEQVSGESFEAFMQKNLFDPLQMTNSRVWNLLSADTTFNNKTNSFNALSGIRLRPTYLDGIAGDGGIFASVEDFLIWDQFWYGNELISDSLRMAAMTPPTLESGNKTDYAFGWIKQGDIVWHNGSWLGARTFIGRNTTNQTCLVLLDNGANLSFNDILKELKAVKDLEVIPF